MKYDMYQALAYQCSPTIHLRNWLHGRSIIKFDIRQLLPEIDFQRVFYNIWQKQQNEYLAFLISQSSERNKSIIRTCEPCACQVKPVTCTSHLSLCLTLQHDQYIKWFVYVCLRLTGWSCVVCRTSGLEDKIFKERHWKQSLCVHLEPNTPVSENVTGEISVGLHLVLLGVVSY